MKQTAVFKSRILLSFSKYYKNISNFPGSMYAKCRTKNKNKNFTKLMTKSLAVKRKASHIVTVDGLTRVPAAIN